MLDLGSQSFDTFSLDWYSDRVEPGNSKSARSHMEMVYNSCAEFAHQFGRRPGNLLLFGNPGLGKTHLSAAIAGGQRRRVVRGVRYGGACLLPL